MSYFACYAQTLPVKTMNLDDLMPLTTICDNNSYDYDLKEKRKLKLYVSNKGTGRPRLFFLPLRSYTPI
jgi:hypothetical protein